MVGARAGRHPVLVFVHGESYEWGTGNAYDGSVLAAHARLVVVTLNYRLGILGFLRPGVRKKTLGNFGLLDIVAALQWVQENIEAFHGDPGNVTLMGHGTGAACVNLLMTSPIAHGLFQRGILMSGSALAPWAMAHDPVTVTLDVTRALGCPLEDGGEDTAACLRSRSLDDLLSVRVQGTRHTTTFGPIVDEIVIMSEPRRNLEIYGDLFARHHLLQGVVAAESYHLFSARQLQFGLQERQREQMIGSFLQNNYPLRPKEIFAVPTTHVYLLRASFPAPPHFFPFSITIHNQNATPSFSPSPPKGSSPTSHLYHKNPSSTIRSTPSTTPTPILNAISTNLQHFKLPHPRPPHPTLIALSSLPPAVMVEYTDWNEPGSDTGGGMREKAMDIFSDALYVAPQVRLADLHSAVQLQSYFYVFTHQSREGLYPDAYGCIHGQELPYVFGAPLVGGLGPFHSNFTATEILLSELVMTYWSNFIHSGILCIKRDPKRGKPGLEKAGVCKNLNDSAFRDTVGLARIPARIARGLHELPVGLGLRPNVRSRYRADKVAVWNVLLPELLRMGVDTAAVGSFYPSQEPPVGWPRSTTRPPYWVTGQHPVAQDRVDDTPQGNRSVSTLAAGFRVGGNGIALSIVLVVGLSMLCLNLCIFAGIYYQRDQLRQKALLLKRHYVLKTETDLEAERELDKILELDKRKKRKKHPVKETRIDECLQTSDPESPDESPVDPAPTTPRKTPTGAHRSPPPDEREEPPPPPGPPPDKPPRQAETQAQIENQVYATVHPRRSRKARSEAPADRYATISGISTPGDKVHVSSSTLTLRVTDQGIVKAKPKAESIQAKSVPNILQQPGDPSRPDATDPKLKPFPNVVQQPRRPGTSTLDHPKPKILPRQEELPDYHRPPSLQAGPRSVTDPTPPPLMFRLQKSSSASAATPRRDHGILKDHSKYDSADIPKSVRLPKQKRKSTPVRLPQLPSTESSDTINSSQSSFNVLAPANKFFRKKLPKTTENVPS
ncbi:unnamed protein product [Darwinula stevensoni]|uniref:Carboxylesterase type B domain-containing protein n=1 Tax=Darwinula stevensoni TaxID=69355 RepID=A0A7R8XEH8_9CRUS|nr:unnamed protein product [Darwinula stevensoni]CAG0890631.1 unnamed protein product [Darwinula stevensoni]